VFLIYVFIVKYPSSHCAIRDHGLSIGLA